ncbi:hypothetical protein [Paraburkholderia sp.]|uniref:hypothetical protein n=1 Tax=Paraburkholderia sp. TaxID=1926495 RepID=UPI0039E5D0F6
MIRFDGQFSGYRQKFHDESNGATENGRAQQPADADIPSSQYGNSPRVPQNLSNAQAFEYAPDAVSGDVVDLAGSEGTPRNNHAQNKQFKAVVKALRLNQDQARQLHDDISKQGLGYHEMLKRGQDLFGGGSD